MVSTCTDVVLDALDRYGIDTVFGIPGVHTLELYRSLARSPLRHVTPRHEQGAAFMADGFARASGRPAVCILITGPGLMNAATAIGQAYSDSVPMIVISTVNRLEDLGLGRNRLHEIPDQLQAMHSLTRSALRLHHPNQAAPALDLAFSRLTLERPRPVYLEIPLDVAGAPAEPPFRTTGQIYRAGPDPVALRNAADLLASALRPAMILGGGAVAAGPQALALSERLGTAIVTTVAGKGIVPQTHPHSLGATLNDPATRKVLDQADLILAVGTELASPDHFGDTLPIHARLIRIDIDPNVLVRDNPPDIGICSDAQAALAGLLDATSHLKRPCWIDAAAILEGYRSRIREQKPSHAAFLDVLERSLDPDAIVVTDMTQIAYTGNNYFASSFPRSWLHPVGFGTLGYAMPAAIGAKLADPRRQVVAVAGDYGFGFTAQELATASDLGISLPILIWNNGGLGQIASDMDKLAIPRLGVDIAPPDFASLARAYGAAYREPGALSDLPSLLEEARDVGGPTLIEIPPRLTR